MSQPARPLPRVLLCLLFALAAGSRALAGDQDWKPVDPAQLAMKSPAVEPSADAEAIFWEVRADDGGEQDFVLSNYIRIKIFTERGRESQGKVELPYFGDVRIKDVAARTIKPDGSVVELKKEDIFDKTIVRQGDRKLRAKTFALQGVEPGAIIEYRWREVHPNSSANNVRLRFQRDIPVANVTYYVKPSTDLVGVSAIRFLPFRMATPKFNKEKNGFYSAAMTNVPAYREEPYMPPEDEVRRWMLVYYSVDEKEDPASYWNKIGKGVGELMKSDMKVNDAVRQKAAEIVGDAQTPEQKLERLYDFCRTKIKNLSDDAAGLTDVDRAKLKDAKSPADTLKQMQGSSSAINMLFAALAQASGSEARVALLGDRSDHFFDRGIANSYFIDLAVIAVKVGDAWRFYDPSETYLPAGMLAWQAEMQDALVTDPKQPVWVRTPLSPPDNSVERRTAKLKLLEDGTLEGDVHVEYTGHAGAYMKEYNDDDSPQQREETLRDSLKRRLSTAELSDIRIENANDPVKPFAYDYKVRVPGYAQRTGKRLFLQPAFFERGVAPLFSTSDRQNMIYFHYPWAEDDTVEIALPEGFALDNADAPMPFAAEGVSRYEVKIGVTPGGRSLVYHRTFFFGGGGGRGILFPAAAYPQLKGLFDELNKRDNHTITLKQGAASALGSTSN
ncbi:MAG TPA: DUF3857 and transglutaminase domain-containing protein [Pyrinomonadaceae bacterium]|jgi:hypothetical protein|nr:DUF3857 and transglutaminase domain-containing protein [Pyrinomonadaceae bacterium]